MSYSRPTDFPSWQTIHPRPFPGDFSAVPEPTIPPQLPSAVRGCLFADNYSLTTHVVPAAYPRISPDVLVPEMPANVPSTKPERRHILSKIANDMTARVEKHANGEMGTGSRKVHWNCVNRYVKNDLGDAHSGKRLTLFFAHGSGFSKEIWEPTLRYLLSFPISHQIDEIWSFEAVQCGDSALLNAENLSGIFDCTDGARDILNFLLSYLPSTVAPHELPTHLTRVSTEEHEKRKSDGLQDRTIVAIGHSFGGCISAQAAIHCPVLFSSLILIDPPIVQPFCGAELKKFALGALQRTDRWESREAALKLMSKSPLSSAWDPDVLRTFVEHALTSDPRGGVKLKCPPVQEALIYADFMVPYEVWELIEHLDERVELRWINPGENPAFRLQSDEAQRVLAWRRPQNSSNSRIPSVGHLIPHEAPLGLAEDICHFLMRKYGTRVSRL